MGAPPARNLNMAVGILGNAISGLQASQVAIKNTSNNIANVNNEGYARREVTYQTRELGGVEILDIGRIANIFLTRESYNSSAGEKAAEVVAIMHDRLQSVFGDPSSNSSIASKMDAMFAAISELQIDATSAVRRATSINSINQALDEFGRTAEAVQLIRQDANKNISNNVLVINDLLKNINHLNTEIVIARTQKGDYNALLDQQQRALDKLSGLIDIRISGQPDGRVFVASSDGVFLVSAGLSALQYDSAEVATPETIFPRITVHRIDGFTGAINPIGTPFESHITSGELRGLLDMRDVTLPKISEELGELASRLTDELNNVHNDNTAVPAPNQLVGRNTGLVAGDAHGFSGVANFSVVDANGLTVVRVEADFTSNQYRVNGGAPVAFAGTTIGSAVAAINAGLGANGSLSFTNGVMTLTAANPAHGIAMAQDAVASSSRAGRGFSHFFGLNDLVTGVVPAHYETGLAAATAHNFTIGSTVQLKLINKTGEIVRDVTLTVGGATIADLVAQLNAGLGPYSSFALNAKGKLVETKAPGQEDNVLYATNDNTDRGGTGVKLSELFGLGPNARQLQPTDLRVRNDIIVNNNLLALAKLNVTAPGLSALGIADIRGALALHALENKVTSFSLAGNLSGINATISDYTGQFLSNTARLSAQAQTFHEDRKGIHNEVVAQLSEVSGVNLDEELATLVVFQSAYNASARMIRAADELLQTLIDAI